jgi:histidinol-phosphate phosphatase family protein
MEGERPAVFIDRDGTLIEDIPYLGDPALVRLLPGAVEGLQRLRQAGFACIVATNQSAVGRGMITLAQKHAVQAEITRQLTVGGAALDGVYWCTHAPQLADKVVIEHVDRKPGPGMLLRAARELTLDLASSWIIGDQLSDMLAGRNAGCRGGILVRSASNLLPAFAVLGEDWPVAEDLLAAATMILTNAKCKMQNAK